MDRRKFIKKIGFGSLAGLSVAACSQDKVTTETKGQQTSTNQTFEWKMVTTWPKNFPIYGVAMERLAKRVYEMSAGRLHIKVYGAGELLPAFESLDAVSKGAVEMAHSSAYYWAGRNPALQFFSSIPFGMNAMQMEAWLHKGGGLELWQQAYKPFNVIPIPTGNTGAQMAGWFNREINSADDLQGLKMRIPGLGGHVLNKLGGTAINLPGPDILTAMQTGAVDAAEWVNPYLDLSFGLHKVAKYYYYPGWQEPGTTLESLINYDAFNALPQDLQEILYSAAQTAGTEMWNDYVANNGEALHKIRQMGSIELRRLPQGVLDELRTAATTAAASIAQTSEFAQQVYRSYMDFLEQTRHWLDLSERAYYDITSKS